MAPRVDMQRYSSYRGTALMEPEIHTSKVSEVGLRDYLPRMSRGLVDCLIFGAVFLVAGRVSLGRSGDELLLPLPWAVAMMLGCMLLSGVYRGTAQRNCSTMLYRTSLAFMLAAFPVLALVEYTVSGPDELRFGLFFLFLAFIVMNTLQPLMADSERRRAAMLANRASRQVGDTSGS